MVTAVVVLATCVACLWPSGNIDRLLSSAGLSGLPASAEDVVVERQGGAFEWQFVYVRFRAARDDISRFVDESAVTRVDQHTAPVLAAFRIKGVTDPPWWPQRAWINHEVYGVTSRGPLAGVSVNSKRYYGGLVVDRETNTVYVRFMGQGRLFRLRHRLRF
jgi:hypothetical protein